MSVLYLWTQRSFTVFQVSTKYFEVGTIEQIEVGTTEQIKQNIAGLVCLFMISNEKCNTRYTPSNF